MRLSGFRPHAEDATRPERPPALFDGLAAIEGISIRIGVGMRALEEIEHDRVVGTSGIFGIFGFDGISGLANVIGHIANP
jgi:hypothetical protein